MTRVLLSRYILFMILGIVHLTIIISIKQRLYIHNSLYIKRIDAFLIEWKNALNCGLNKVAVL